MNWVKHWELTSKHISSTQLLLWRIETIAFEISDHFGCISKKYLELGNLFSKSGGYWESVEKYLEPENELPNDFFLSDSLKYMKAACLSASSSMLKPVELFKTNIHHFSRNNRKKIEPLNEMIGLRIQLNKEYTDDLKKVVAAGDLEVDKNKKPKHVRWFDTSQSW